MRLFRNKYLITLIAFAIWMLFFDQNKLGNRHRLNTNLHNLKQQKEYYLQEIEKNRIMTEALRHDSAFLERFARENYLMKRDNEDVYVVVPE
jgi:cell division protein DivIC